MLTFIKLHNEAKMPNRATYGSAGYDLYSHRVTYEAGTWTGRVFTGVSVIIPTGYVGLLAVRSSAGLRGYTLKNSVGIIDSDYRGELIAELYNSVEPPEIGTSILQMVVVPTYMGTDNTLNAENIRVGGFGSTLKDDYVGGLIC